MGALEKHRARCSFLSDEVCLYKALIDPPKVRSPISSSTTICLFKDHSPPIQYFHHFCILFSNSISQANTTSRFLYFQPLNPTETHPISSKHAYLQPIRYFGGAVSFKSANPLQRRDGPVPGVATFNDYATQFQQSGTVCGIAAPGNLTLQSFSSTNKS